MISLNIRWKPPNTTGLKTFIKKLIPDVKVVIMRMRVNERDCNGLDKMTFFLAPFTEKSKSVYSYDLAWFQ